MPRTMAEKDKYNLIPMTNSAKMFNNKNASLMLNQTSYITSETYHALNQNGSEIHIIKSTSTLFYDLDMLAKRHSYHFVPEYPISDKKIAKHNIEKCHKNVFGAKSETIVQECATQIKPTLKRLDSLKIASKNMKKRSFNESMLSSEIFLRDNDYTKRLSDSFVKNKNDLGQKFWSYAKYQTQYTNPLPEMKKCKKKDRGKRTEDPCPCQLFSYACPCTDKKSLTELAKNSKSLTVADQITSTPNFLLQEDHNQKYSKIKQSKCSSYCEDKPTNITGLTKQHEITAVYEEPVTTKKGIPKHIEDKGQNVKSCVNNGIKMENRPHKKSKQVICPNCKETLEILSTEDEESLKSKKSLNYQTNQISSSPEHQNYKNNNIDEIDTCIHDPPCELVPVCQILPTDNIYNMNPKCVRRVSLTKHNPKAIRITKACRHHPPCIVVPSCQRLNVLKNNCEFIPPCLHRPRCVNVPLCVPFSKSLNYDHILNKKVDNQDLTEYCAYFPPSKMTSAYQQESLNYTNQTCEYVSEYSPRFILSPHMPSTSPTFSPYHQPSQLPCQCCKSNKSCQYDCVDCTCIPRTEVKDCASSDEIIYIRDVGCQFRSENFVPKDSLVESKTSSTSFDLTSAKAGNYYSNYHTLRYEDKCTNPNSGEEVSLSTFATSSLEIDAHCPSHGIQASKKHATGFSPQSMTSPFVAAFSTYKDSILQYQLISDEMSRVSSKSDSIDMLTYLTKFPVKSRRSFLKGKSKKVFSIRRRKKFKRNKASSSSSKINNI